jgi:hypothetical protein
MNFHTGLSQNDFSSSFVSFFELDSELDSLSDSSSFFFFQKARFHSFFTHLYIAYHVTQNPTVRNIFFHGCSFRFSPLRTSLHCSHIQSHAFQKNHFSSAVSPGFCSSCCVCVCVVSVASFLSVLLHSDGFSLIELFKPNVFS